MLALRVVAVEIVTLPLEPVPKGDVAEQSNWEFGGPYEWATGESERTATVLKEKRSNNIREAAVFRRPPEGFIYAPASRSMS